MKNRPWQGVLRPFKALQGHGVLRELDQRDAPSDRDCDEWDSDEGRPARCAVRTMGSCGVATGFHVFFFRGF